MKLINYLRLPREPEGTLETQADSPAHTWTEWATFPLSLLSEEPTDERSSEIHRQTNAWVVSRDCREVGCYFDSEVARVCWLSAGCPSGPFLVLSRSLSTKPQSSLFVVYCSKVFSKHLVRVYDGSWRARRRIFDLPAQMLSPLFSCSPMTLS